ISRFLPPASTTSISDRTANLSVSSALLAISSANEGKRTTKSNRKTESDCRIQSKWQKEKNAYRCSSSRGTLERSLHFDPSHSPAHSQSPTTLSPSQHQHPSSFSF